MRRLTPEILAALCAMGIVLAGIGVPLMDDDLFWWTPKGLLVAEHGPRFILAGELPSALRPDLGLPRQWADGIPDYGHPPLWFWWLGAWFKMAGAHARSVHLAVLPVAMATGWGLAALLRRMGGHRAALGGIAILVTPPLVVHLERRYRRGSFGVDGVVIGGPFGRQVAVVCGSPALATWVKEPGVLLVVPAQWLAFSVEGGIGRCFPQPWLWGHGERFITR